MGRGTPYYDISPERGAERFLMIDLLRALNKGAVEYQINIVLGTWFQELRERLLPSVGDMDVPINPTLEHAIKVELRESLNESSCAGFTSPMEMPSLARNVLPTLV